MSQQIWGMSELAAAIGTDRRVIWWRLRHNLLPEPAYYSVNGIAYWSDRQAADIIDNWVDDLRTGRFDGT